MWHPLLIPLCIGFLSFTHAYSQDIRDGGQLCQLQAPLTSYYYATQEFSSNIHAIQAQIFVPDDAPYDLGVGAFIKDDDGNWFQLTQRMTLRPGHHHLHFDTSMDQAWQSEPHFDRWNNHKKNLGREYGLFFWSHSTSNARIHIRDIRAINIPPSQDASATNTYVLSNLQWQGLSTDGSHCTIRTGQRWTMQCMPSPLPDNPYDSDAFRLDGIIKGPEGTHRIAGFYKQPMNIIDGGNRDQAVVQGPGHFEIRFRPRLPGTYTMHLEATWNHNTDQEIKKIIPMPRIEVSGHTWDDFVRIDEKDFRFFRVGSEKKFYWPLGLNIRSVTDPRGTQRTHSQVTPARIVQAYQAYFERLSKAGGNSVEIWMASWNLGLEWYDQWPNFHGIGVYNQANAERLDRILDAAYALGIRVILVMNNHGQASLRTDREWRYSPFNSRNGGPFRKAESIFTDPRSLHAQQERRRYIAARYADHPAILAWKLWSEMDLTDIARNRRNGPELLKTWHQQAFAQWGENDIYDHPVTSHWSGNYRKPYRSLVELKAMDFTAIDAYHFRNSNKQNPVLFADLMYNSTLHARHGLSAFKKPVVVTEFGGSPAAAPELQLQAEHGSGPWAALVSGHGSSPYLWWFEWVDQGNNWQPYRAISRYLHNEDLRNSTARSVKLGITHPNNKKLWCRAWLKPGTLYGYVLDWSWGYDGKKMPLHHTTQIHIGKHIAAGTMHIEWWDASLGHIVAHNKIQHHGGELILNIPDFRRHIAFKLKRE